MTPQEKLLQHEELINLIVEHGYIPGRSEAAFGEVICALKEIAPSGNYRTDCSGCISETVKMADIHLRIYKESLPKFHAFPNQEKK
jgi:hypothetical protein